MWKRSLIIKIAALALLIGLAVVCIGSGSSPKSADWQTSSITDNGTVAGYPLGSVLIGDPRQIGPDVRIHMVDTLCREKECRIIVVGIDGQTHRGRMDIRLNPSRICRSTLIIFSGINLEDIDQLKFQTRSSQQQIAGITHKSKISNAARKKMLIDQASEGRLFESNYIN